MPLCNTPADYLTFERVLAEAQEMMISSGAFPRIETVPLTRHTPTPSYWRRAALSVAPPPSWLESLAIVDTVDAPIVQGAVKAHPVGLVHAPSIAVGGADRKRRCDLDPALLRDGDGPDLVGNLGEIWS